MVEGIGTPLSASTVAHQMQNPMGINAPGENASMQEVEAVAKKLEGVFFSMFVKEMRKTMTEGSMFGEGPGSETYEGFFDQMMGEHLGETGGLGISDMVIENARLSRERMTMEAMQASLAEKSSESAVAPVVTENGRENNERATASKPE